MNLDNGVPTAYSKVKKIRVSPEILTEMFKEKNHSVKVTKGLPNDAKLIRIMDCQKSADYWFVYESEEFELVKESMPIPKINDVEFERVDSE